MSGLIVLEVPQFFHAGHNRTSLALPLLIFIATGASDDNIRLVLVEFFLGGANSGIEVVVIKGRVDDGMAVVLQVRRFDAARNRVPAVEKEYEHGGRLSHRTAALVARAAERHRR